MSDKSSKSPTRALSSIMLFQMYNDKQKWILYNIYNFEGLDEHSFTMFDVTQCFSGDKMDKRAIRLGWTASMDIGANMNAVIEGVREQAKIGAGVTPLRIQNIEATLF